MSAAKFAGLMYYMDKTMTIGQLVEHASKEYERRYGRPPAEVRCNPADLDKALNETTAVVYGKALQASVYVLPGYVFVGRDEIPDGLRSEPV
jgi:hypothetical protein